MQRVLIGGGASLLAYCCFVWLDAFAFDQAERGRFESLVTPVVATPSVEPGSIGRLEISRLGVSVAVVEGTGSKALRRAVGHLVGTAMPGGHGNVGIAGHRDTFFRPLRNIRSSDIITLTTAEGEYRYSVFSTRVVSPSQVEVLEPGGKELLTLVTCYPFYMVGSAPDRFIVRAKRIS